MALDLELMVELISEAWSNPNPLVDPIEQMADAFEEYWSGASIVVPNHEGPLLVNPIFGIMLPALEPLRSLPGTAERAATTFYEAWIDLVQASTWTQPAFEPHIPDPVTLSPEVNLEDLGAELLPLISEVKLYIPAPEFCSAIHSWCLGTVVFILDEDGNPVETSVI